MTPRQRNYLRSHASTLSPADLARGARTSEKEARAFLRKEGLQAIDAPRQLRLPFLFPQLPLPVSSPPSGTDRRLALACATVSFMVYLITCARDITGGDGGELATAANALGVARPPGFPLWCLLGKVFTWIPVGSIAFRIALLSAVASAAAVGVVCLLLTRLTASRPGAAAASLLLAFSSEFWGQAVTPGITSLSAFLLAAPLYLAWRWYEERSSRLLFALALLVGLSLANHPGTAPLALLLLLFVFLVHWTIWREPGLLPLTFTLTAVPLLLYAYLPIRAESQPILNWGNPRSFEDVLDHVLLKPLSSASSSAPRTFAGTWAQAILVFRLAASQYSPWLGWLALPGAVLAIRGNRRFGLMLAGIFIVCSLGVALFLNLDVTDRESVRASRSLFLPAWLVAAIWIGYSLAALVTILARIHMPRPERVAWAACSLAIVPLLMHFRADDRSRDRFVRQYTEAVLATLPPNALILCSDDRASSPLLYVQGVEGRRLDVAIADKYGYTDPALVFLAPAELGGGLSRVPSPEVDQRLRDWLLSTTQRPVYATNRSSLAGLPGSKWVQEGILHRLVRVGESFSPRQGMFETYDLSALAGAAPEGENNLLVSEVLAARGSDRASRGDIDGARLDFAASASVAHGMRRGLIYLGSACVDSGLLPEAAQYFEAAAQLDPEDTLTLRKLAGVYAGLKRWTQAKKILERLIARDPKDLETRYQLVDLLRASGQTRLAIFELEKIAKEHPKDPRPLEAAGNLSLEDNDSLGALTYFQRAMSLDPSRLDLLDKVQSLLSGTWNDGGRDAMDPFGAPGVPRIPRPPDPFRGSNPGANGIDPFGNGPRR